MRLRQVGSAAACVLAGVLLGGRSPAVSAQEQDRLLVGATLIDGTGAAPVENAWIRLSGNRISAVGQGTPPSAPGAQVVNLAGKTVIPGLADLHAHVGGLSNARWSLKLLLAHGITTVFDPSSSLGHIAAVKRWVATEEAVPHFYAANTALQGSYTEQQFLQPGNEVATKVEDFASFGVDFIKVYNFLSSAALVQVGELSRKYGIPVTGHTPLSWTSVGSIDAGIKILQHIRVRPYEVIDDLEIVARYPVDGALMKRTAFWAHARPDARTLNQTLDLWAKRKEKFFVTPTLVVQEAIAESYDYPDARFEKTPGLTLISPALLARFKKGSPPVHWGKLSPAEIAEAKKSTDGMAMFVRLAHQRGVRILAGTDMPVPVAGAGHQPAPRTSALRREGGDDSRGSDSERHRPCRRSARSVGPRHHQARSDRRSRHCRRTGRKRHHRAVERRSRHPRWPVVHPGPAARGSGQAGCPGHPGIVT